MSSRQRSNTQQQMQQRQEQESSSKSEGLVFDQVAYESGSAAPLEEDYLGGESEISQQVMSTLDSQARELAQIVTEEFLNPTAEGKIYLPETNICYSDVECDSERFRSQLDFCAERGVYIPCLHVREGDPIPIDFANGASLDEDSQSQLQCLYEATRYRVASEEESLQDQTQTKWHEPDEAKYFFRRRLIRFLTSRFKSGVPRSSPGVPFRVVTGSPGRRVHYSRAYFFDPSLVFGGPTSPVDGHLHPGRYVFGVAGPGLAKPVFNFNAEFDVPEIREAYLVEL